MKPTIKTAPIKRLGQSFELIRINALADDGRMTLRQLSRLCSTLLTRRRSISDQRRFAAFTH